MKHGEGRHAAYGVRRRARRCLAAALAGVLALSLIDFGGIGGVNAVQADEDTTNENYFTDGDLGDDEEAAGFWDNQTWLFEGNTWSVTNNIGYNRYADYGDSGSGLEINYNTNGTVSMYQTVKNLSVGTYTVTGYIKGSSGTIQCYYRSTDADATDILCVDDEGNTSSCDISSDFTQFTFSFTLETEGTYNVGFQITDVSGAWVCVDTLYLMLNEDDDNDSGNDDDSDSGDTVIYLEDLETTTDNSTSGIDSDWAVTWSADSSNRASAVETGSGDNTTQVWNIWTSSAQTLTISRTITGLEAGTYTASYDTAGGSVTTGSMTISDGTTTVSAGMTLNAWNDYETNSTTNSLTVAADASITLTITAEMPDNGWFKMDNITITKTATTSENTAKQTKLAELKTLIDSCGALTESDYKAAGWTALQEALEDANTFYATYKDDASGTTTDAIEKQITALTEAKNALIAASVVDANIFVDKIDDLDDDFIEGVDVSSYLSEKNSGVVYKDADGNELSDAGFFKLLADSGVNWVRIRVWVDPYDSSGNGYGGGNNDLETAKKIGKWASDADLKVLIDFHYSDFWADPDSQQAPKAWADYTVDEKETAIYDYTYNSLVALSDADVNVRMVQIGNETNNGICGETEWTNRAKLYKSGSSAVRAYEEYKYGTTPDDATDDEVTNGSEVMVALHFTNPDTGVQATIAEKLDDYDVDYDVFATSYYPFWHGTLSNLKSTLSSIASTYSKKVMVAETSYAYTWEDGDGHENNVRSDQASSLDLNYNISIQGQADAISDVIETINDTTNGIGMFYWEPAWVPVEKYDADAEDAATVLASNKTKWETYGSGWASSYSAEYDPENAGRYYGGSAWDNQAMFDSDGKALDSLNVFKYVRTGATTTVRADVTKSTSVTFVLGEDYTLPTTVTVVNNDTTEYSATVTWDADQVAVLDEGIGSYTISGTADGLDAICNVEILPVNLLTNGDFETGDTTGWTIENDTNDVVEVKNSDAKRGSYALKPDPWDTTADNITITQTVDNLSAGVYTCFMNVQGGGTSGTYEITLSATSGETTKTTESAELLGWLIWDKEQIDDLEVEEGGSVTVTITLNTTELEDTWLTIDDVFLYRVGDLPTTDDDTTTDDKTTDNTTKSDTTKSDTTTKNDTTTDTTTKNDTTASEQTTAEETVTQPEEGKETILSSFRASVAAGTTSNKLTWHKVAGADGYMIYASRCNHDGKICKTKKVKTITNADTTTWTHKNLKKNTWYKYRVVAYKLVNGKKMRFGRSYTLHSLTKGSKTYTNPTKVTVKKSSLSVKVGKKKTISAKVVLPSGKKTKWHTDKLRYISSNKKVATVTSKGVIKGKKKGTCTIYVMAQNGVYKKVKVTVK